MNQAFDFIFKRLHLLTSLVIVVPTAIIYGFALATLLTQHLDIQVATTDLSNFMRAIMCLYIGVSIIWLLGIINNNCWKVATQLNLLFMATLCLGRLLSMLLDGMPSEGYVFAVIAELLLAALAIYQLRRYTITYPSY